MTRRPSRLSVALTAALTAALALTLLLFARTARAEVTIERYALDAAMPAEDDDDAAYTLTLVYRAQGERKSTGFKFVGQSKPRSLRVTDAQGKVLPANSEREDSSGEYKINFDLPSPDEGGLQTVKISFVQALSVKYGWGEREAKIPWAATFRVPVTTMEVSVTGPDGLSAPSDFQCEKLMRVTCSRTSSGTRSVSVDLPHEDSQGSIAAMIAALVAAAVGLFFVARNRYKKLVALRGVIPPASPVAYPEGAWGYRAPPPLPVEQEPKPVLPEEERSSFVMRVTMGASVLLAMLAFVAVTVSGRSPAPMPVVLAIFTLVGALLTWPFLIMEKTVAWLPGAVVASSFGLLLTGGLLGVGVGLFPLLLWGMSSIPSSTSSSSGGGSSCSSSSCGGGGGGCGGGGGGGGCGG